MSRVSFYSQLSPEDLLHVAVLKYIELAYSKARFLHAPLEGKRGAFAAYKATMLGITKSKGFPDLLIIFKGKTIAIELKTEETYMSKRGVVSKEQTEWLEFLNENNIPAFEAYGFDEAKKIIDDSFAELKKTK